MIITADLHIRDTRPKSRIDDWNEAQWKKLDFIFEQAAKSPPLLIAGDIFDTPRASPGLITTLMLYLQDNNLNYENVFVIPGQHDLPYNQMKHINNSALSILETSGFITIANKYLNRWRDNASWNPKVFLDIYGVGFGETPYDIVIKSNPKFNPFRVLLWHKLVIKNKREWPGQHAGFANGILTRLGYYFNLIITGDNHKTFVEHVKDRWLINPGSMMRTRANQLNHVPVIFKWEIGYTKPEVIKLPISAKNVIDNTHIIDEKEKSNRITAFVKKLKKSYSPSLSFKQNLKSIIIKNKVNKKTQDVIWEAFSNE